MNAEQVNAIGGWCELIGVAFLVRDLMSLARFREKPKEWAAWIKQWKGGVRDWWAGTPVMGWWRRLLGRERHVTFVEAGTATVTLSAHGVTQSSGMGTLTLSGRSLQDQIEELRQRINELGEQLASESDSGSRTSPRSERPGVRRCRPRPKSGSTGSPQCSTTSRSCVT